MEARGRMWMTALVRRCGLGELARRGAWGFRSGLFTPGLAVSAARPFPSPTELLSRGVDQLMRFECCEDEDLVGAVRPPLLDDHVVASGQPCFDA